MEIEEAYEEDVVAKKAPTSLPGIQYIDDDPFSSV